MHCSVPHVLWSTFVVGYVSAFSSSSASITSTSASSPGSGSGNGCGEGSWKSKVRYDDEASDGEEPEVLAPRRFAGATNFDVEITSIELYNNRLVAQDFLDNITLSQLLRAAGVDENTVILQFLESAFGKATVAKFVSFAGNKVLWRGVEFATGANPLSRLLDVTLVTAPRIFEIVAKSDLFSHTYLVIDTADGYHFSVEKWCDYIDVRRTKEREVLLTSQAGPTTRIESRAQWQSSYMCQGATLSTVQEFVQQELSVEYAFLGSNCKHFAHTLHCKLAPGCKTPELEFLLNNYMRDLAKLLMALAQILAPEFLGSKWWEGRTDL